MSYYPSHTLILHSTRLLRERTLPEGIQGRVLVEKGQGVLPDTVVARSTRPDNYRIFDVADALGLDPEDRELMAQVIPFKAGDKVDARQPLADYNKKTRLIPRAPAEALVRLVDQGRIVLQLDPKALEVKAQVQGNVVEVTPRRGVVVETQGSLLQCAWGNGRFRAARFAFEPGFEYGNVQSHQGGLQELYGQDASLSNFRGMVIILLRQLTKLDLDTVVDQEMGGIVAPGMPVALRDQALHMQVPVILTEGFGNLQPNLRLYDILAERQGTYPASFDAAQPDPRRNLRPEIIITTTSSVKRDTPTPETAAPLAVGMRVTVRRAPYRGRVGRIVELPALPQVVESGLRVPCAAVQFSGERATIPLANLESLGELPS